MVATSAKPAPASLPLGVYVGRIHKQVSGGADLADPARRALAGTAAALMRKLAAEAGKIAKEQKAQTINSKHALAAVRLGVFGELGKHARAEADPSYGVDQTAGAPQVHEVEARRDGAALAVLLAREPAYFDGV